MIPSLNEIRRRVRDAHIAELQRTATERRNARLDERRDHHDPLDIRAFEFTWQRAPRSFLPRVTQRSHHTAVLAHLRERVELP